MFPLTALCWKPQKENEHNVETFKAVGSDGRIVMWRPKFGNELKTLLVSETNSYQCMDYSPDAGSKFVAAGRLPQLEVYDDHRLAKVTDI